MKKSIMLIFILIVRQPNRRLKPELLRRESKHRSRLTTQISRFLQKRSKSLTGMFWVHVQAITNWPRSLQRSILPFIPM